MHKEIDDLKKKEVTKDELQRMLDSSKAKLEEMMDTKMDGLK
jgi:arsenate reductase-like glutaredoxin family protein